MRTRKSPRNQMILWRQIARQLETQSRQNSENPMPQLTRKYPLIRREPVTKLPCDTAFDRAMDARRKTIDQLRSASSVCIFTAGKILLSALRHFDHSDADLDTFQKSFTAALAERDLQSMGHACRDFLAPIDRSKIEWNDESSAETALITAVDHYSNAIEDWGMEDYDAAHRYTVMARSSLTKLGD